MPEHLLGNTRRGKKAQGKHHQHKPRHALHGWHQGRHHVVPQKICTSNGMLRNSSTHALPSRVTMGLLGNVRNVPISEPMTNASNKASSDTDTVQPQTDSIQSR